MPGIKRMPKKIEFDSSSQFIHLVSLKKIDQNFNQSFKNLNFHIFCSIDHLVPPISSPTNKAKFAARVITIDDTKKKYNYRKIEVKSGSESKDLNVSFESNGKTDEEEWESKPKRRHISPQ